MRDLIITNIELQAPLLAQAKKVALTVVGHLNFERDIKKLSKQFLDMIMKDAKRLTNKSYLQGKQQSYDFIARVPPINKPDIAKHDTPSEALNTRRATWLFDIQQTSGALISAVNTWAATMKANGMSDENINQVVQADLDTVNTDTGVPAGRVTGSYLRKYITDFESVVADANLAGQKDGYHLED